MDNKGLNINRPLLSVRRFSSSQKKENRKNESLCSVNKSLTESCKPESTMMNTTRSVPFGWERSPGLPKNEKNKQIQAVESPPSVPKITPSKFFKSRKIFKAECSKVRTKECSGYLNDGTYSSGEMSLNSCSSSGVIGLGTDVKSSGVIRAEPKMRDIMLGRFLPAARAVAAEVPQRAFKKSGIKEKTKEVKKLGKMGCKNKGHDDYDTDYEYYENGPKSFTFCGLVPRFRSVNPVNGMCIKAKLPNSPANRTHASSSSSSSFRETVSEPARSGAYKHGSWSGVLNVESTERANVEGSKLYSRLQGPISVDVSGSIQSTASEQSTPNSKRKGICFSGPGMSVNLSGSMQSTYSEQSDSSSKKKGLTFWELLADKKNTNEVTETDSQDSITEKTVYIDTVQIAESPKPQSSFNEPLESDMPADDTKHDMKGRKYNYSYTDFESFDDVKGKEKVKGYEPRLFQHPAPPPLPKSPSDSWLCRTLPSVSSKKAHALWIPIYVSTNTVADDPKTDENDQLQSPQEQMNPMPES